MDSYAGVPFVGENGFYPRWAKRARWVFQRTVVIMGRFSVAELEAAALPCANEVIVWVPGHRGLLAGLISSTAHDERQLALNQLSQLRLRCYGDNCELIPYSEATAKAVVQERGIWPEEWGLACPRCRAVVGPDMTRIEPDLVEERWHSTGRPPLENPGAGADIQPAPLINDLPLWISRTRPTERELCYVAQQMWSDISCMLNSVEVSV